MESISSVASEIISQEIENEAKKLAEHIRAMELSLQRAMAAQNIDSSGDKSWSKSYQQWENYEDTDELAANISSAKKALQKLRQRSQKRKKNCDVVNECCGRRSHCGCSGNKQSERRVVAMSTQERLNHMRAFKEDGNAFYEEKEYAKALPLYEKALVYFEYCFGGTIDERKKADELRLQCLLNSAACLLNLGMYSQCVQCCNEALEIDSKNIKAWFRRAKAHRLQDNFEVAENDLRKLLAIKGGACAEIDIELELLKDRKKCFKNRSLDFAQKALAG